MPRPPIIDMHLHAAAIQPQPDGSARPRMAIPGPFVPEPDLTPRTSEEQLERTLEEMDRHNVVLGYVTARTQGLLDT
ncbi:MAG: hypothetical protein QF357_11640 [Dehalococcoidia bacterium]|nr:hypothetical protein [Dehalococcoidia bacterium]